MRQIMIFPLILMLSASWCLCESKTNPPVAKDDGMDQLCKSVECRGPMEFVINKEDGSVEKFKFKRMPPPIQGDMVTILPGEKLYLSLIKQDSKIVGIKLVRTPSESEKVIEFSLKQGDPAPEKHGTILEVKNRYPMPVKYKASMMLLDGTLKTTSTCPVGSGLSSIEHWPHPIFQLVLTDFQFVKENSEAAKKCE